MKVIRKTYHDDGNPPTTDYDDTPPRTVSRSEQEDTGLVKRNNFLPAKTGGRVDFGAVTRVADSAMTQPTNGDIDAAALTSLATNIETSRPMERALATTIRLASLLAIVGAVAWAVGLAFEQEWVMFFLFALGAIVAVVWVVRNDNRHSPAGIELSKIDGYVDIRTAEIESNERVSLAKLEAYTKTLDKVYGDDND